MHAIQNSRARILGAVVISVAAHVCVLPLIAYLWPAQQAVDQVSYSVVTIVPVSEPVESPPAEPEREVPTQQFVDLSEPESEEVPDEADFADRFDRTVERETRERDVGDVVLRSSSAAGRGVPEAPEQESVAQSIPRAEPQVASLELPR
ncbi:MAG: hypothetical protein ACJAYU_005222, partial [Bradymonadia bacterium]